ncbi:hypothetical protein [Halorhabdus amylolytica]|uniref:hypothetical protein n=1 Tax=Halorhabdus amylolytica TaxID=2559573 RepID=UPI0010AAF5AB|nr:hypothetical protein [Halorhabdus amylolytica]
MPESIEAPGESAVDRLAYESRKDGGISLRDLWDVKMPILIGALTLAGAIYTLRPGYSGEFSLVPRVLISVWVVLSGLPWWLDGLERIHPSVRSLEEIDDEIRYRSGISRHLIPGMVPLWAMAWTGLLCTALAWPLSVSDVAGIALVVVVILLIDRLPEVL